jgi:hypothetical protein
MQLDIRFGAKVPITLGDDLERYVVHHEGEITVRGELDGAGHHGGEVVIGRVAAARVHVGLAWDREEQLFEIADRHGPRMMEIYAAMFDTDTDEYRDYVCEGTGSLDMLYIPRIELLPEHHATLATRVLRRTIEFVGSGCSAVVVEGAPSAREVAAALEHAEALRPLAVALGAHAVQLGFRPLPGTDLQVFDLAFPLRRDGGARPIAPPPDELDDAADLTTPMQPASGAIFQLETRGAASVRRRKERSAPPRAMSARRR